MPRSQMPSSIGYVFSSGGRLGLGPRLADSSWGRSADERFEVGAIFRVADLLCIVD